MTPHEFIDKWSGSPLNERGAYQLHFLDLCALVGHEPPTPQSAATYRFERGAALFPARPGDRQPSTPSCGRP